MQWRRNIKDVRARDLGWLASDCKILATPLRDVKLETATKRASSTRPDGEIRAPCPIADDLALRAARGAGINQVRELSSEKLPAPLDAVETDDVDDGGKRAPGARLGREVVGRELGHLLRHDAAARLRLVGLVDGVLRRGVRRG